ncbi:hypothetical protein VIGAN_04403700 [Vigna angularis var. angularis]|uniref:NADP-dependent oxidoreductase domain-containing protein n=1 Tax=Vigna angularis var. angularis TaxID=157739 RepID=A0A0S3S0S4_PHAAN|nr:hypothetical protein VIGAN_04403700 [Vigna angularis var. angularis]
MMIGKMNGGTVMMTCGWRCGGTMLFAVVRGCAAVMLPMTLGRRWKLGLEYVDLYLTHWPVRLKPEARGPADMLKENVMPSFDMKGIWEAMEECCILGLAKFVGVCNFGIKKLNQLLENTTIPPVVNHQKDSNKEDAVVFGVTKLVAENVKKRAPLHVVQREDCSRSQEKHGLSPGQSSWRSSVRSWVVIDEECTI